MKPSHRTFRNICSSVVKSIFLSGFVFLSVTAQSKIKLGDDILVEKHLNLLKGKRVGLVVNHTARLSSGEFLVDVLMQQGINVVALFGPEHGVRGDASAGEKISDTKDEKTGIPIFSLYGKTRKPTAEMLADVDVLVYDVQDVGARFYTYISTMGLCMEAAAEKGIPFIVLDRPNPLGGLKVDGPIMEDSLKSFVGMYPIPVVYGLTCGELATMINEEGWLAKKGKAKLTVIKMDGWKRGMHWEDTGLTWIPPSPNIKTPATAIAYPATCFIEATNISEGRGTEFPFQLIGAPFVKGEDLRKALMSKYFETHVAQVTPQEFVPTNSKYKGEVCGGVLISLEPVNGFFPVAAGVYIIGQLRKLYPEQFKLNRAPFLRLMGSTTVYSLLVQGVDADAIASLWEKDSIDFKQKSMKFHFYE